MKGGSRLSSNWCEPPWAGSLERMPSSSACGSSMLWAPEDHPVRQLLCLADLAESVKIKVTEVRPASATAGDLYQERFLHPRKCGLMANWVSQ